MQRSPKFISISMIRTLSSVLLVSLLKKFDCIILGQFFINFEIPQKLILRSVPSDVSTEFNQGKFYFFSMVQNGQWTIY